MVEQGDMANNAIHQFVKQKIDDVAKPRSEAIVGDLEHQKSLLKKDNKEIWDILADFGFLPQRVMWVPSNPYDPTSPPFKTPIDMLSVGILKDGQVKSEAFMVGDGSLLKFRIEEGAPSSVLADGVELSAPEYISLHSSVIASAARVFEQNFTL